MRTYWLAPVLAFGILSSGWAQPPDPPKGAKAVIPPGAGWQYLAGTEPRGNWTAVKYDAKGWKTGKAGFGYGDNDDTTKLPMQGKYTRVYIRKTFDGKPKGEVGIAIRYDDAFIAYLNGKEVLRVGVKGRGAKASGVANHEASKLEYFPLRNAARILVDGRNVLAIEGHNISKTSSDFTLDPRLLAGTAPVAKKPAAKKPAPKPAAKKPAPKPAAKAPIKKVAPVKLAALVAPLLKPHGKWQYHTGSDPAADWAKPGFNAKGWKTGNAGFGYGDEDDRTTLNIMGKFPRVYIRLSFAGKPISDSPELGLLVDYDDAFIAYLNGTEVARSGITGSGAKATNIASHEAEGFDYFAIKNWKKLLVPGTNVLALEGHNTTLDSSDFSLDPYLFIGGEAKAIASIRPTYDTPPPAEFKPRAPQPVAHPANAPCGTAIADAAILAKWQEVGVKPASPADDAEFMRRVTLDVVGVIPSVAEAGQFLADKSADRRAKLVDRLLKDPRYSLHWADVWSGVLVGFDNNRRYTRYRHEQKRDLARMLAVNMPYDEFAKRIASFSGNVNQNSTGSYVVKLRQQFGSRNLPLGMASTLSRAFMGIQIQCAQCHDHPFDRWTQEDFYGMASFFTQVTTRTVKKKKGQKRDTIFVEDQMKDKKGRVRKPRNVTMPDKKQAMPPAFILGNSGAQDGGKPRRLDFAAHLVSRENLQFARMCVNRYWAHFFGRGIVNPVDDFNAKNKPSHPEMLEALAKDLVAHHFDLHFLIKTITSTRAYQLDSRVAGDRDDPTVKKYFAAAQTRALTPEQIMRSVFQATSYDRLDRRMMSKKAEDRKKALESHISTFQAAFGSEEGSEIAEFAGTTPSALLMMNSGIMGTGTRAQNGKGFLLMLEKLQTPEQKFRAIYLATVSRPPLPEELKRWTAYAAKVKGNVAYEDAMWTLLNSSEFILNH